MATSQAEPLFPGTPVDGRHLHNQSRLLPDLNEYLLAHSDLRTFFVGLCRKLNRALPHQYAGIALYESGSGHLRLFTQQTPPGASALPEDFIFPLDGTPAGEVFRLQRPIVVDDLRSPQFLCETTRELVLRGQRSGCWVPLRVTQGVLGALWIGSDQPGAYTRDDTFLLNDIAVTVALTLHDHRNSQRIQELERRIAAGPGEVLHSDCASPSHEIFHAGTIGMVPRPEGEDIAAESAAMRKILSDLERVAPTNATMQLLGETAQARTCWPA